MPAHPSLAFLELIKKLGRFGPQSPKDVTVMQRLLIRAGVVDSDTAARAAAMQPASGATFGRVLASLGVADEAIVASAIASALHLEYFDGDVSLVPVAVGKRSGKSRIPSTSAPRNA